MRTLSINKFFINCSAFFYFFFLLTTNLIKSYYVHYVFYISLIICSIGGVIFGRFNLNLIFKKIVVLFLLVSAGILNHYFTGYTTVNDLFFLILYYFTSFTLVNTSLDKDLLLFILWLYIIIILFQLFRVGIHGQTFISATRNFVSVYLLYPTVIYYSVLSRRSNYKINLIPALIIWGVALYARGRGGIISVTFFVSSLFILKYRSFHTKRRLVVSLLLLIIIGVIAYNFDNIFYRINNLGAMEFFKLNGLSSSRMKFWPEYIQEARSSIRSFAFGPDVSRTSIGIELDNNPHNSFLEIHMRSGIFGIIILSIVLFNNVVFSIKNKNYLFLVCMTTILIRGFTDHFLWASYGTPIFFFFMNFYDNEKIFQVSKKSIFTHHQKVFIKTIRLNR